MRTSTFPDVLSDLVRADSARPLVTFYDDATGERVELSVATYANWVSKTAALAQDELDVGRGGLALLDLPAHWLGAVWLGAALTLGLAVTTDASSVDEADLVVCGPGGVEGYADAAAARPVVALSLRPLGARFAEPLPAGVTDYGSVVLAQPDVFVALDPPVAEDAGWSTAEGTLSQAELLARADGGALVEEHGRLLTDVNPCSDAGLNALLSPVLRRAGVVLVAHPDPAGWDRRYDEERATAVLRAAHA